MSNAFIRILWSNKCQPFNNIINKFVVPNTVMSCNRKRNVTTAQNGQERMQTVQELKLKLAKTMGIEVGYKPIRPSRSNLLQYLPSSQDELPPRSMQDSFLAALIPLSTDLVLQDKYITFMGTVRLGRLLEDMDIFAVMVAEKHIKNPKQQEGQPFPYTLVTVLVDKIDFTDYRPRPQEDIKITGHVSWVGKTSIEVVVWLEQQSHGIWRKMTRALFLMAARDPTNTKAAFINPINPATDREKKILAGGEERKQRRIMLQRQHLSKVVPNDEEQKLIHNLFLRTAHINDISLKKQSLPSNCVWMENSTLTNLVFSHPEDRNLHNTVFGGFIMRCALELSWAMGYLFTKRQPTLKSISNISFNRPIEVNSLIRMHAHVVYTQMQYIQITVYAETWDSTTGKNATTNSFHFTYEVPELNPEVIPSTYYEAMMYLDGRRQFLDVINNSDRDHTQKMSIMDSKL